ncbi:MAG: hypothetical protein ACRAVC_10105 [Trichormus sp.]
MWVGSGETRGAGVQGDKGDNGEVFTRKMGLKPRPYFDKLSNHLGRLS